MAAQDSFFPEIERTTHQQDDRRTIENLPLRPTVESYQDLELCFDFINHYLIKSVFGVELPHVVITMPQSARFMGYFHADSWHSSTNESASEIALNPQFFRTNKAILQTMAHEMIHHGQHHFPEAFGAPGKRGYHALSFSQAMEKIGLITSATGKPGGDRTGVKMSDYPQEGGLFEQAHTLFESLGYDIRWSSAAHLKSRVRPGDSSSTGGAVDAAAQAEAEKLRKRKSKTKYLCPTCQTAAWGKPGIRLGCIPCGQAMTESSTSNNGASHV